jgi:hypothetical protein
MRLVVMRRCLVAAALALAVPAAAAREAHIVALIVAAGPSAHEADAFQAAMRRFGAVTERLDQPGDSDLRSAVRRFADAAKAADVAIVFLSAGALRLGERDFVAPANLELARPNDLLTRSVPLSAFARAADLAGQGGAVLVMPTDPGMPLPEGVRTTELAPQVGEAMSPILFVPEAGVETALGVFQSAAEHETVELNALLRLAAEAEGASVAGLTPRLVYLREAERPAAAPPAEDPAAATAVPEAVAAADPAAPAPAGTEAAPEGGERIGAWSPPSVETLAALEASLSRASRRDIQRGLNVRGFYEGAIDGVIGERTREAIRRFQQSENAEPTGYLTARQIELLVTGR